MATFSAYEDFSFRDKWTGIYITDEKVANYLAVKTKWGWAAPENTLQNQDILTENGIKFHHNINGHRVSTSVEFHPGRGVVQHATMRIRVDGSEKNVLELGLCGRHAYAKSCGTAQLRGNKITIGRTSLTIDADTGTGVIDMGVREHVQGNEHYKIHVVQAEFSHEITLTLSRHPRTTVYHRKITASFRSDSPAWNELYAMAKRTIDVLQKRRGWYAGLPWFVQYWGRDTFISVPALVREGKATEVKRCLAEFLSKTRDGEAPRLIREDGTTEFGSIDTTPLLVNAVADYVTASGDYQFLSEHVGRIKEILSGVQELPRSKGKDTWMDTLENRKYAIEVAAYVVSGIRKMARLGICEKEDVTAVLDRWVRDRKKYLIERSANIILAATYGAVTPEEAISTAKDWKLVGEWGIKSWSPLEPEYEPEAYHLGATWGLTTAAGLYVALAAGDWRTAATLRDALLKRAKWTHYLDEVWSSRSGQPTGADAQLWTAAMIIRAIDEVMVDRRMLPPEIGQIRRIRWERGALKKIRIDRRS